MRSTYSGGIGRGWLARGGVYVLANIRGGGEYGPAWHTSAIRENKQRSYDDFIAVAEDLIKTGVTTPSQLGIRGGSNGGLLVSSPSPLVKPRMMATPGLSPCAPSIWARAKL